ncbi:TrbG/VirB9 family P-type conjugative transfer protein [Zooshikella marina]|uniref:TrbG/VirB9 family P-type conjugative transfer protein n=1 Tax=Zooshikella ganghwensis TaxID=202772 RepID=UPI00041D7AC3|nr:TrbG/VirB9 family P-type conjugative transfer protein [Zooshikella ganghwensis]MBU2708478.1 TrbG/VirB9 family P-type conjugative transfer protein [Zooshikella ganghwensis]
MKKLITTTLLASSLVTVNVLANSCKKINWEPGKIYTIYAPFNGWTHIELPDNVLTSQKGPLMLLGNEALWEKTGGANHLYIQPNSKEPEGETTTLHVISEQGLSFNFNVRRTYQRNTPCYTIINKGENLNNVTAALTNYIHPAAYQAQQQMTFWKAKYEEASAQQQEKVDDAVKAALRRYRHFIYTRYQWDSNSGFIGKDIVSDVYDDGRFTYIRLLNDNKGILAIEATVADKPEIIQAKYDDVTNLYRVVGIYPAFRLKYDDIEIAIERRDGITKGAF